MKFSVRTKVLLAFSVAVVLVCITGGIAFFYIHKFSQDIQNILKTDALIAKIGEEIRIYILEARRAEQNFVIFRDDAFIEENNQSLARLRATLQKGQEVARKEQTKERYKKIEELLKEYEARFAQLINTDREDWENRVNFSLELRTVVDQILQLANQLSQDTWSELTMHAQQAKQIEATAKRNMLLIFALTLLSSLLLGWYLPGQIVRPIRHLTDLMKEAEKEGKLEIYADIESNDEIGELGRFVNRIITQAKIFDQLKVQKIAEEQRKLKLLANLLSDSVLIVDPPSRLSFVNTASLALLHPDLREYQGNLFSELPLPLPLKEEIQRSITDHVPIQGKLLRLPPANGKPAKKISLSTAFVRDEEGEIGSVIVVCHEVDEGEKFSFDSSQEEKIQEIVSEIVTRIKEVFLLSKDTPPLLKEGKLQK